MSLDFWLRAYALRVVKLKMILLWSDFVPYLPFAEKWELFMPPNVC